MYCYGTPKNTKNKSEKSNRAFVESHADKLGMDPKTYYQKYIEKINKQNAYIVAYAEEVLGDIEDSEDETKYIEKFDKLLDDLVKENEDEIKILIK